MKPDGATMETPELSEAAAVAERSSQENVNEEAQIQPEAAAPAETQKANGKPLAADPKIKPKAAGSKIQQTSCAGAAGSSSRPGTASHRTERDIKSSSAGRKAAAAAAGGGVAAASKPSAAGAVPKRPAGVPAVSSTAKNQPRAFERKPVGPVKTADATITNGTKLRVAPNGISKKPAAEAANGARPKTTAATNRPVASAAPKPNASNPTKPAAPASSRTTRPAAGPSTSRATSTFSKPAAAATTKISTTATSRVASSRAAAAPSAGRSAGAQLNKNPPVKKDVSRPPSAAAAKKPLTTTLTASPVAKTKETSKTTTAVKPNSAPTATKAADPKASLGKVQSVVKPTQTKKPAAVARFPPSTRPPLGRTPPCSPAGRPSTPAAKRRTTKPTQTVSPFTQKAAKVASPVAEPQIAAPSATAAESVQVADAVTAVTTAAVVSAVEEVQPQQGRAAEPEEEAQYINTTSPPTSPPFREQSEDRAAPLPEPEQLSSPAKPSSPTVASSSARLPQEADQNASTNAVNPTEPSTAQMAAAIINLNEEEDEEEREGSQLVSVSEMSGTTQPTEESRPGSGGPVGKAAWKAGSALLSELDSEEVSGSQQGASELSAPGVLEGTESTDDLGDGSLKGAIDMELASVGSPDFEKVPDIPANEFEDEDEDDSDRVCDMEVGSERTDEPRRPRHDNDVDEDEDDDDVEMASEGVTESGLESYGNADEDDFAEDNLDNLNRVLQPLPPPPPVLPSAPAAQWDRPNPFASPWEEPPQSHIPGESKASANCEASAQSAAQTWLEVGSAPSALERQDVCHHSSLPNEPQNVEPVGPARETALPGDQGDQNQEGKLPGHVFEASAQPDGDCQDAQVQRGEQEEEEEEAEPETLPADEVLGGPSTAPTSNPSSSSVTEDEASDTEGEAQLDESMKCPPVSNLTFDMQPPLPQRCLSTVEEGEEVESFIADEATPPSAASLASYNFDSVTTASNSNSNAQSTGESCIKSPGIFSLEELSEEAKEPCLNPEPDAQRHAAEYIECGKQQEEEAAERVELELRGSEDATAKPEEIAEDIQPPYYSTICEKTEDSFAGFAAIPHPHRRDHSSYPRTFCDLVKPVISATASPKLTCTDLPPRSLGQQALSPQLRRLEQHQRQLLELQQRRAQQSRPLEEAEQERKRRVEEEQRKKKDEAEEEIKRNKADEERRKKEEEQELQQRRGLELQLQQQQQELQQRQQIMQWQQELQQSNKSQNALLSPSSGLCTIYEALESSEDEETPERNPDLDPTQPGPDPHEQMCPSCDSDRLSPERPPPLDLDWGKKVDIVQQLINQTLLLNGDGCSSLLLLPGGAGGTLSPLESSLWPSLLPPLTPPSATVTSVSSFSPEATGSSPQGEWTVVELETHH